MVLIIGQMFFGLLVGLVAKLLLPGHDPGGLLVTLLLGIMGAWVGGQLGGWLGWYEPSHPAGFFMAVVGAILVLLVYRSVVQDHEQRAQAEPPRGPYAGEAWSGTQTCGHEGDS